MTEQDQPTIEPAEQSEPEEVTAADAAGQSAEEQPGEAEPETFPAAYVKQLREEAKDHRTKAKEAGDRADTLAQRLHAALVAATGRLADPSDLPYDAEHLDDPDKLTAAIDGLLQAKPHLASRRPVGQIGQGETGGSGSVDLAAMLRSRA